MKIISHMLRIAVILSFMAPLQLHAQLDMTIAEKEAQLEEIQSEIARLEVENESLRQQLADFEMRIMDYKTQIEVLDEQIEASTAGDPLDG